MYLDELDKEKKERNKEQVKHSDELNKKKKETEWILALANSMQLDPNRVISQGEHEYWQGMYQDYLIEKELKR